MSMRFTAAINKPGFNPLAAQTTTYLYNLFGWGFNNNGQLGLNNRTSYSSPMQVGSLTDWLTISAGYFDGASVKTDGTLWTWGKNHRGQLGFGNLTYYSSPKQVGALTNWSKVAINEHTLAVKTDGTLWAWGNNPYGQLGTGNTTYFSSPVQVGALSNWSDVATGYQWSIAIKTDGTLWSWGTNGYGQLGDGTAVASRSSPVQIGALTTWLRVRVGTYTALAVKTDGTLWAWGNNYYGQLGLGTSGAYANKSSPTQVGALTTWSLPAAGRSNAAAVKTDGTLWTWGNNPYGELGLGNRTLYSSPKQVGALTNWLKVSCGNYNTFSIKTDGTLWSWGYAGQGNLGLGNTTNYSSPKQVGSSTSWSQISANDQGFCLSLG